MNKFEWMTYVLSAYKVRKSEAADIIDIVIVLPEKYHEVLIRTGMNMIEKFVSPEKTNDILRATVAELFEVIVFDLEEED